MFITSNRGMIPFNAESLRMDGDQLWGDWYTRAKSVMDSLGLDPEGPSAIKGIDTERMDAGESYFLERQLHYVMTERLKEDRAPNKAELFLPVNSSMPSGATTWLYTVMRAAGKAQVITDYSADLPPVNVVQSEVSGKVVSIGNSFHYSVDELRQAAYAAQPLQRDHMDAAADEVDNTMDEIAAFGHQANNLPGFLNNAAVPLIVLPTGSWPTATPKQILADLRYMEHTIGRAVYYNPARMPDTVLFDQVSWEILSEEISEFSDVSILARFLASSQSVKNADVWHKLDKADATQTGPRIVMYPRDPGVLEMIVPQTFEMLPPQPKNLAFIVPTHAKIGGVDIRRPYTMGYSDSID